MFPYYGPITQLTNDLSAVRSKLKAAYKTVLGERMFRIVEDADKKYLGPESFQTDQLLAKAGKQARTVSNRFIFSTSWESEPVFHADGSFTGRRVLMAPGFVFNDEAHQRTAERYQDWISPYLGPYIHEYDHFVIWALQSRPIALASTILYEAVRPPRYPISPSDIPDLVMSHEGTREERALVGAYAAWAAVLDSFYESSTRRLDAEIYQQLGYQPAEQYLKTKPKHYIAVPLPTEPSLNYSALEDLSLPHILNVQAWAALAPELTKRGFSLIIVPDGDMLHGAPITTRLSYLEEWLERLKPSHPFQKRFAQSLLMMRPKKVRLQELFNKESGRK